MAEHWRDEKVRCCKRQRAPSQQLVAFISVTKMEVFQPPRFLLQIFSFSYLISIKLAHWDVTKAGVIVIFLEVCGGRCLCIDTEITGDANKANMKDCLDVWLLALFLFIKKLDEMKRLIPLFLLPLLLLLKTKLIKWIPTTHNSEKG